MDHKSVRRFVGSAKTNEGLQAEATKLQSGVRSSEHSPTSARAATEGCSTAASKQQLRTFCCTKRRTEMPQAFRLPRTRGRSVK